MKVLITGGAGFIGANAAQRFLADGHHVVVLDNLSRVGTNLNLAWLRTLGGELTFQPLDVRNDREVLAAMTAHQDAEVVLHLAAQVAVTTSTVDPRTDFDINALGTFNVLEAARGLPNLRAFLYTSTNKVYGAMEQLQIVERNGRYRYAELPRGVAEDAPLDFHSPYGCSKGAADQYVIDYSRVYGLPGVVFRQSCIYGPRQFGVEDQGWVAWFCIAAALGHQITVYGDGKQVRDVLHVRDLVELYCRAIDRIDQARGQAFNVGGGPDNTLSLLELLDLLRERLGRPLDPLYGDWRTGDQKVFVANIAKAEQLLGWKPAIGATQGVGELLDWVQANADTVKVVLANR
ncbi:MAG: SDR family NAD(P)-dependent oxidoreductase [Chloroflexi bacterium]|nr:SDR family NAD(P)-dependent oxidoreductase [Chloroflexota bacterium]